MALLPDHPPRLFRWRRVLHRVALAEGPERLEPEWWRPDETMAPRDYFRVEDEDGRRFWLYREQTPARHRWYLHGLFG
jgi:protein ImuB